MTRPQILEQTVIRLLNTTPRNVWINEREWRQNLKNQALEFYATYTNQPTHFKPSEIRKAILDACGRLQLRYEQETHIVPRLVERRLIMFIPIE